jgi:hypothetical protein
MPIALTIARDDYTAAELREAATRSNDADATRRMLALDPGELRLQAGKREIHEMTFAMDGGLRFGYPSRCYCTI